MLPLDRPGVLCKPSQARVSFASSQEPNVVHFLCRDGEPLGWPCLGGGRIDSPEASPLSCVLVPSGGSILVLSLQWGGRDPFCVPRI